ncbi:MAG: DUF5615 family PIN-like protein [Bacteroidota bacterium]
MRLLLDENLSPAWVGWLAGEGIEAVHWLTVGAPADPDEDVLAYAKDHGYILFSHDLDFSAILASSGDGAPSVIQLRMQDVLPETAGPLVVRALRQFEHEIEAGALLSVDARKTRVRVLPLH